MAQDPEQQTPQENPHPGATPRTSVLPFDIEEFRPEQQRTRSWFRLSRPNFAEYSGPPASARNNFRSACGHLGAAVWYVLLIGMLFALLVVFVFDRFGEWSSQAAYPGSEACYHAERWLHEINSDIARIQWALADAEVEVTNEVEAEEANDRLWQMFADMRTRLAENPAPEGLAKLRGLWLNFLDLGLVIREANQRGDTEILDRLHQEQDEVLAQRVEEEARIVRICGLADSDAVKERANWVWNSGHREITMWAPSFREVK